MKNFLLLMALLSKRIWYLHSFTVNLIDVCANSLRGSLGGSMGRKAWIRYREELYVRGSVGYV